MKASDSAILAVPCTTIKALDLFLLIESQGNADELTHLVLIVEFIDWTSVPISSTRRPKKWHHFFPYFSNQFEKARVNVNTNIVIGTFMSWKFAQLET